MADLAHVRVEWDGELAIVFVDRQEKLNALNADVVREIGQVFASLRGDDNVLGVILTGAGDKAFVAGADIGEPLNAIASSSANTSDTNTFMP